MYNEYSNLPVNKIKGKNRDDCIAQLFEKYGTNYRIVDWHSNVKESFLGLFNKTYVEASYIIQTPNSNFSNTNSLNNSDSFEKNKDALLNSLGTNAVTTKQLASLDKKLDSMMEEFSSKMADIKAGTDKVHITIERISELLEENEFSKEYIKEICDKIRSRFSLEELDDFDSVEKQVVDWIGESITIAKKKAYRPPHVMAIVGPTGVGKTTTIAKLAAQQIIAANKNGLKEPVIRLISADITRVAAEEQLRRYGNLLEMQVDKAENADDIKAIYRECKDNTDIIIIDTSGYSPNDSEKIGRLKQTLSVDSIKADIYLAFSASTKLRDLRNIIQNYEPFGFSSVIVTKCDETNQYGNIISILSEKRKSVSFVTYGQAPGKDISRPTVVSFLKRLSGFKIDRVHIEDKFGDN